MSDINTITIEIVQGDVSKIFKFKRTTVDKVVITTLPQKMWITFKKTFNNNKALIQKTLADGTITYNKDDNYYRFKLLSEDTADLAYGDYGFDIAIINEQGEKKTLLKNGVLKVLEHYTKKNNEV